MNKRNQILSAAAGLTLLMGNALPAFAEHTSASPTAAQSGAKNSEQTKLADWRDRADREIERRIEALNKFETRVETLKKIGDAQKTSLGTSLQSQLTDLAALQTKVAADADLATLRADVQSLAKSYRPFALVIPQSATIAAADRALALIGTMTTVGEKLETRIADAKAAGSDVAALETSLADYAAKLKDAKTQAQAAIDAVTKLAPDNGDKAKMAANLNALKDARAKIQAAQQDFVAARKDAKDITQKLRTFPAPTGTEATPETSD